MRQDERSAEELEADRQLGLRLQAELPRTRERRARELGPTARDLDETIFREGWWPDWLPNPFGSIALALNIVRFVWRCVKRLGAWLKRKASR